MGTWTKESAGKGSSSKTLAAPMHKKVMMSGNKGVSKLWEILLLDFTPYCDEK